MFDTFFANGSLIAFLLMTYGLAVMFTAIRMTDDPLDTPRALRHPLAMIIMMISMPCAIWPAVYVGLFDGWIAGIVAMLILQIGAGLLRGIVNAGEMYFGVHFVAASIAVFVGYWLSIQSLLS